MVTTRYPPTTASPYSHGDFEDRFECVQCAHLSPEENRNGWTCPYPERTKVENVATWLPELDRSPIYVKGADAFRTTCDLDLFEVF